MNLLLTRNHVMNVLQPPIAKSTRHPLCFDGRALLSRGNYRMKTQGCKDIAMAFCLKVVEF